ncbi:uncharacterized protein UHOD_11004 [Ustilago sp. UG-2017b]|nr:uncharacterized protein UHOD_11004 [Ustilago sp. UG-2017b]
MSVRQDTPRWARGLDRERVQTQKRRNRSRTGTGDQRSQYKKWRARARSSDERQSINLAWWHDTRRCVVRVSPSLLTGKALFVEIEYVQLRKAQMCGELFETRVWVFLTDPDDLAAGNSCRRVHVPSSGISSLHSALDTFVVLAF